MSLSLSALVRRITPVLGPLAATIAIAVLIEAGSVTSVAQQQVSDDRETALSDKLVREINEGLTCRADVLALRRQVEALSAELDKLRAVPLPRSAPESRENP